MRIKGSTPNSRAVITIRQIIGIQEPYEFRVLARSRASQTFSNPLA
jgi:hypothetical protein